MKTLFYTFIAFSFIFSANNFKNSIESDKNNQLVKNSLSSLDKIIIKDNSLEMLPTIIVLETDFFLCSRECDIQMAFCLSPNILGGGGVNFAYCISEWRQCIRDCDDIFPL